jgi:asparagine synthase (glutamine-hydrolysing)
MRVFTPTAAPELFLAHARYRHFAQGLAKRRGMPPGRIRTAGFHDGVAATRDLWHEAAGMMSEAERLELTGPALLHTLVFAAPDAYGLSLEEAGPGDAMARASLLDLRMRLPARDLPALHVASALTGATFVAPFLDGALLELLAGLPDAARRWLLPSPAVAPSAGDPAWHPLGPALREFTEDNLLGAPARARGLFSRARVEALLHRHAASPARDPRPVWMLLGMEVWCQTFLGTELDMDRMEPAEPDMPAEVQAAA